jgi:hypothetical protein
VFQEHRGRCYEREIAFASLVNWLFASILPYGTSAFDTLQQKAEWEELEASYGAYYAKLRRAPLAVSCELLGEVSARLRKLLPPQGLHGVPASLQAFVILRVDGKTIKFVAKRLAVSRKFGKGGLLGGKCLIAFECASGLVSVMNAAPDGESNETLLVPGVVRGAQNHIPGPRLFVADRQFCDTVQPLLFSSVPGDHWIVRRHSKVTFTPDPERSCASQDSQGRQVIEEWGELTATRNRLRTPARCLRVIRPGTTELQILTSLVEAKYSAADILDAYFQRWDIECLLQKISQLFDLRHLVGSTPQATVLQFSLCLVLHNVIEVLRQFIAAENGVATASLSTPKIYREVRRQLTAMRTLSTPPEVAAILKCLPDLDSSESMTAFLRDIAAQLAKDRWIKSPNKPRGQRPEKPPIPKRRTSVHRLMNSNNAEP